MSEKKHRLKLPGDLQTAALIRFLPEFGSAVQPAASWKAKRGELPTCTLTPRAEQLLRAFDDLGFVQEFDWPKWQKVASRYWKRPALIRSASLETLCRLITLHVRKDRYVEGHFAEAIESGEIAAILDRLVTLHARQVARSIPTRLRREIHKALSAGLNFFEGGDRNPVLFITTKEGRHLVDLHSVGGALNARFLEEMRQMIRSLSEGGCLYVFIWDGYVTTHGRRSDAVVAEAGMAGGDVGFIFAQRYFRARRGILTKVGRPFLVQPTLHLWRAEVRQQTASTRS